MIEIIEALYDLFVVGDTQETPLLHKNLFVTMVDSYSGFEIFLNI